MKDEEKIRECLKTNGSLSRLFLPGASLRYTKLLVGMDLSFADLSNSDLTGADLSKCNLSHVNLSSADLRDAIFNDSNLRYAILEDAEIENASFWCADLSFANISGLDIDEGNFVGAIMSDVEENDYYEEDEECYEPITCPICDADGSCEHLFVSYDVTFKYLDGGYLYSRLDPLAERIIDVLGKYISVHGFTGKTVNTNSDEFNQLWEDIIINHAYHSPKHPNLTLPDLVNDSEFVPFLLEICNAFYDSREFDSGFPGSASQSIFFYSKEPETDYEKMKQNLEDFLVRNFSIQ